MANTDNRPSLLHRNTFYNSAQSNGYPHVEGNDHRSLSSAFYQVEVMFRKYLLTFECWETFIFTDFEQAARFAQNANVVKSKIFFLPKQCSHARRRMYPISKVLAYVDLSGWTFHVFICGNNCADEDICCRFGTLRAGQSGSHNLNRALQRLSSRR